VRVLAKLPSLEALSKHPELGGIAPLFPPIDARPVGCAGVRDLTVAEYPIGNTEARIMLVTYTGCCETKCRKNPETREWQCGRQVFPLSCRKDVLVESQEGRYRALAASSFPRFDPGGGDPKTRVFYMDLTGDRAPEVVRWEELRQYQHTEWLIQAYQGEGRTVRRIADIRFHHTGPWRPDLNFPDRNQNQVREIELAVQEFDDMRRRVVVRRRIYQWDRGIKKYVLARTLVYNPPGLK
jgi:hypothetical protein